MAAYDVVGSIVHYQRSIDRSQEQENMKRILHCLQKLERLPIQFEHLQATGIGKTVNSLRKFDGEVSAAAKDLISKWKVIVWGDKEDVAEREREEQSGTQQQQKHLPQSSSNDWNEETNGQNRSPENNAEEEEEYRPEEPAMVPSHHNRKEHHIHNRKHHDHKSSEKSSHREKHKTNSVSGIHEHSQQQQHTQQHHHHQPNASVDYQTVTGELPNEASVRHHSPANSSDREESRTKTHQERGRHHDRDSHKRRKDKDKKKEKDRKHHSDKHHEKHSKSESDKSLKRKRESHSRHRHQVEVKNEKEAKRPKHEDKKSKGEKHHKSGHRKESKSSHKSDEKHKHHKAKKESRHHKRSSSGSRKDEQQQQQQKPQKSQSIEAAAALSLPSISIDTATATAGRKRHQLADDDDHNFAKPSKPSPSSKRPKLNGAANDDNDTTGWIDSSMGTNFNDVLGMMDQRLDTPKKSTTVGTPRRSGHGVPETLAVKKTSSSAHIDRTPSTSRAGAAAAAITTPNEMLPSTSRSMYLKTPDLLSPSVNLAPLDPSIALELPTISNNYKPMPLNQTVMDCVFNTANSSASKAQAKAISEADALAKGISSKTVRTKIYSGVKSGQIFQVPSLIDLCVRVLQKNIDAFEFVGGVPFDVLRPVLERATPAQLYNVEHYNPHLMEDSDELWKLHCQRNYRTQKRQEMETWREMFLRCQEDQDRRLSQLTANIKQTQKAIAAPVRKTQLAYVDSLAKPPRNIQKRQEQYGTQSKMVASPAARVAALSSFIPNAAKVGDSRLRVEPMARNVSRTPASASRAKKAPLMAKTIQLYRGRHKR